MQKYTAIILSSRDVNEYDRIYFLYTKESGLVKVIGRGVRKPAAKLAGHLEPGTLSEIYVARSRGMGQITGAIIVSNFGNIKKDFARLGETLEIFRFFVKSFAEGEKDEKIFSLIADFLELINRSVPKTKSWEDSQDLVLGILVEAFWWRLFDFLGARPEVTKCVACAKRLQEGEKNFWSVSRGGVLCGDCEGSGRSLHPISENAIKLVRLFLANPLGKILKVKAGEAELGRLGRIRKEFMKYNF